MKGLILVQVFVMFFGIANAQDSTVEKKLTLSGFLDVYYQYDFDKPQSNERASFIYNHKRHNKVAVNLALLQLTYKNKKIKPILV